MITEFSIARRAANLVDVLFPKRAGVVGYRLKASSTLNGTYTTILTANIGAGYLDPNVNAAKLHSQPGQSHVRAVFDPDSFTGTAGIVDVNQFWLTFTPVDAANSEGTPTAPVLVLTPSQHNAVSLVAISGTAPNEATVEDSLAIQLPRRMKAIVIQNNHASADLFVAFVAGGSEIQVPFGQSYSGLLGGTSELYVRGASAVVDFAATFTVAQDFT